MRSDDEQGIHEDLHRLAGSLPHRGPNTKSERVAAQYIADRFRESTADVGFEDFESIDGYLVLFSGYYSEFVLVAILAQWYPYVAAAYGAAVLVAYLAEFTGYRVIARLMPRYQSQNVVARFLGERPRRTYVITAHYDSGRASALSEFANNPHFHWVHRAMVVSMVVAVVGCLLLGARVLAGLPFPADNFILWIATGVLALAAGFLLYAELSADYVRGALDNASGVAALLALSRWFREEPLEDADVWLVATGSKEGWLSGILHHIGSHDFDKASTYFINLDYIGGPSLRYVIAEGMLTVFPCDAGMIAAAEPVAKLHGALPYTHRGLPTDLLVPLTRGFHAMGITTTEEDGSQPHRLQDSDTLVRVDAPDVARCVAFSKDYILRLEESLQRSERPVAPSPFVR